MNAKNTAARFVREERGMELVEYAIMATLVVGGTIFAIGLLLVAVIGQSQDLATLISGS